MRQLTLSTDKDKYGIRLRAEPDHMVLGKRLKGAFKSVTAAIKELKSEQLENFQKMGVYHHHFKPVCPQCFNHTGLLQYCKLCIHLKGYYRVKYKVSLYN